MPSRRGTVLPIQRQCQHAARGTASRGTAIWCGAELRPTVHDTTIGHSRGEACTASVGASRGLDFSETAFAKSAATRHVYPVQHGCARTYPTSYVIVLEARARSLTRPRESRLRQRRGSPGRRPGAHSEQLSFGQVLELHLPSRRYAPTLQLRHRGAGRRRAFELPRWRR